MATSKSSKRAAIYARVSTDDQTTENQLLELRQVAQRCGWSIVHEYIDNGVSGAKGVDRINLSDLFEDAAHSSTHRETRGHVAIAHPSPPSSSQRRLDNSSCPTEP